MKPVKADHLEKLKKVKREQELNGAKGDAKYPEEVLKKIKDNFEIRDKLVKEFKEAKKNKVPGAKLGAADRGKIKEKEPKKENPPKDVPKVEPTQGPKPKK